MEAIKDRLMELEQQRSELERDLEAPLERLTEALRRGEGPTEASDVRELLRDFIPTSARCLCRVSAAFPPPFPG